MCWIRGSLYRVSANKLSRTVAANMSINRTGTCAVCRTVSEPVFGSVRVKGETERRLMIGSTTVEIQNVPKTWSALISLKITSKHEASNVI